MTTNSYNAGNVVNLMPKSAAAEVRFVIMDSK